MEGNHYPLPGQPSRAGAPQEFKDDGHRIVKLVPVSLEKVDGAIVLDLFAAGADQPDPRVLQRLSLQVAAQCEDQPGPGGIVVGPSAVGGAVGLDAHGSQQ